MQVNQINNTSFGARILPSAYLNKAIDIAKKDAVSGTKDGKERAATFFNSLRTIELDGSKKELSIIDIDKNLPPMLKLDGTKRFIESYKEPANIGLAVQEAINAMVDSKYFRGEKIFDAQKVNLEHVFDIWVK